MKMYFVTSNKSKFLEAESILKPVGIKLVQAGFKLNEPNLTNQKEVVLEKAKQAFDKMQSPVIVDDTAIYFNVYKNFPGKLTKDLIQCLGYDGIKKLLNGSNRGAYFQTIICYKDKKVCKIFSGTWKGKIINKVSKKINPDWSYNSIFVPKGFSVPLSEISMEDRIKHSHRKKALLKLLKYLRCGQ
jgi:non-canonical purine NTP pyrophosphatase (RdgB/HAM1 family)